MSADLNPPDSLSLPGSTISASVGETQSRHQKRAAPSGRPCAKCRALCGPGFFSCLALRGVGDKLRHRFRL